MGTATSNRSTAGLAALALGLAALVLGLAGCGRAGTNRAAGSSAAGTRTSASSQAAATVAAPGSAGMGVASRGGFAWLRAVAPPAGWRVATIPIGATMPYPRGWVRLRGDAGTATAALLDSQHHFLGYLNLTPRQSAETLANWARFRVAHNADENDRNIRTLAVGSGLRLRDGRGSCVRDSYATTSGSHYIEVACLIAGTHRSVVVVGASPPQTWARVSPLLERAIVGVSA
jgi:hypothetical protein